MGESKIEREVIPNQRYAGRLKFFDQNGNYGYIMFYVDL